MGTFRMIFFFLPSSDTSLFLSLYFLVWITYITTNHVIADAVLKHSDLFVLFQFSHIEGISPFGENDSIVRP